MSRSNGAQGAGAALAGPTVGVVLLAGFNPFLFLARNELEIPRGYKLLLPDPTTRNSPAVSP